MRKTGQQDRLLTVWMSLKPTEVIKGLRNGGGKQWDGNEKQKKTKGDETHTKYISLQVALGT